MKTTTFRLPDRIVAEIDAEAKKRQVSRSDVVRERLGTYGSSSSGHRSEPSFRELAADLVGSVHGDGQPSDLSVRKKHYLKMWGYGQKRDRG
jgi:hypothetical protein